MIHYHHTLSYIMIHDHTWSHIMIHCHTLSYLVISYLTLSYLIVSYHILSYLIISYHILSYLFIPHHTLSCLIIQYHTWSYTIIPSIPFTLHCIPFRSMPFTLHSIHQCKLIYIHIPSGNQTWLAGKSPNWIEVSSQENTYKSMVHGFQPAMIDDTGGYQFHKSPKKNYRCPIDFP